MSSDYVNSIEIGITPKKKSQYWVAPFVQELFDKLIKTKRPDVAEQMKRQTAMQLS